GRLVRVERELAQVDRLVELHRDRGRRGVQDAVRGRGDGDDVGRGRGRPEQEVEDVDARRVAGGPAVRELRVEDAERAGRVEHVGVVEGAGHRQVVVPGPQ